MASLQLAIGVPYVMFLWLTGLRKAPKMSVDQLVDSVVLVVHQLTTHGLLGPALQAPGCSTHAPSKNRRAQGPMLEVAVRP